jgi:hypothetical protein
MAVGKRSTGLPTVRDGTPAAIQSKTFGVPTTEPQLDGQQQVETARTPTNSSQPFIEYNRP